MPIFPSPRRRRAASLRVLSPVARRVAPVAVLVAALVAGCARQGQAPVAAAPAAAAPRAMAPTFLGIEEGKAVIVRPDEFTAAMSPFDRQSRLGAKEAVTVEAYLAGLPAHVRAFSDAEKARITAAWTAVLERMAAAGLEMPASPATVQLVRTSGAEELGAAAYTRGPTIYFGDGAFAVDEAMLRHLVAHELFHVWSRANPETIRWPAHEALGFVRAPGRSLPASLASLKLTNPDDPRVEETIDVRIGGTEVSVFLALIASSEYRGGSPLEYLKAPQLVDATTGAVHALDAAQGFFEQIGTSTKYILSAEEIAAEYFAMGVFQHEGIRDPALIAAVLKPFAR
jgi:hypothetical protein